MINSSVEAENNMRGYMSKTFSSSLNPSNQHDIEKIRNSFTAGSHYKIKNLPAQIKPGSVEASRLKHIRENQLACNVFKAASALNSSMIPIEYKFSDYGKLDKIKKTDSEINKLDMQIFSRKNFSYNNSRIKLKSEDTFEDKNYEFPLMGPGSNIIPFETMLRKDSSNKKNELAGPFRMTGSYQETIDHKKINEWIIQIHNHLVNDWSHYRFNIKYTKSEEIIFEFDAELINDIEPLKKYMKQFALYGLPSEFHFRKRGDRWAVLENYNIIFSFYAPWAQGSTMNVVKRVNQNIRNEIRLKESIRERNKMKYLIQEEVDNRLLDNI